jgi:hypothetical protein
MMCIDTASTSMKIAAMSINSGSQETDFEAMFTDIVSKSAYIGAMSINSGSQATDFEAMFTDIVAKSVYTEVMSVEIEENSVYTGAKSVYIDPM